MPPVSTPAVLLRGYDYGDSSRILRFCTRDYGLLSVVARGVRGKAGKGTATLSSFASGELTAFVKPHRDLHTMKDFTCGRLRERLGSDVLRFAGASAAAELVLAHAEQQQLEGSFEALESTLDALDGRDAAQVPGTILAGLWTIVEGYGFAPQLDPCVRCGEAVQQSEMARFDFAAGGLRCERCAEDAAGPRVGPRARAQLAELLAGRVPDDLSHFRIHLALLSDFASYHFVAKPLKSFRFLGGMLPADGEARHD